MKYHLAGWISSVVFILTLGGLWAQLALIWKRKADGNGAGSATDILSLNQFASSFLAFFSFFVYGGSLRPVNPYLVWPRFVACLMVLAILGEIARDRREILSISACVIAIVLLVIGSVLLVQQGTFTALVRRLAQGLIVLVTVILGQGYLHQVVLIRQSGRTGSVSIRLHQFFFLKDASTMTFGLVMGLRDGWPVFLLSSVSALTKLVTLWHFHWVRTSPAAMAKRTGAAL
jgi:hypothetical protein